MTAAKENWLNNLIFYFFSLFLFSSTFSIALSQISLGLALIVFLALIILTKKNFFEPELKYFYWAVGIYLLWNIIAALASGTPLKSLLMLKEEWLFLIIPIAVHLMRQRFYRSALMMMLSAGMILVSIYAIIQHYTGWHWFRSWAPPIASDQTYYASGGFHHYLTFGNYFALAATFLLAYAILQKENLTKNLNLLFVSAAILGLVSVVFSYSRMAVAALPLPVLFIAYLKGRKWLFSAIVLVLIVAASALIGMGELSFKFTDGLLQDISKSNQSSRLFIWDKTFELIKDEPLFGVGHGNFETAYAQLLDSSKGETINRPHAHNDVIDKAAVTGIPGAIVYLLIWVVLFWHLHRGWHNSQTSRSKRIFCAAAAVGSIAFFMTSLTEATFSDEEVRQLLMFVWAAGLYPLAGDQPAAQLSTQETS